MSGDGEHEALTEGLWDQLDAPVRNMWGTSRHQTSSVAGRRRFCWVYRPIEGNWTKWLNDTELAEKKLQRRLFGPNEQLPGEESFLSTCSKLGHVCESHDVLRCFTVVGFKLPAAGSVLGEGLQPILQRTTRNIYERVCVWWDLNATRGSTGKQTTWFFISNVFKWAKLVL